MKPVLENTRLYDVLKASMFLPEVERLNFAGATDEIIGEAFKDLYDPKSVYCLMYYKIQTKICNYDSRNILIRNCNITLNYLTDLNKPTYTKLAKDYLLSKTRIHDILEKSFLILGLNLSCKSNITVRDTKRNSYFKYLLHENILEKILEEK